MNEDINIKGKLIIFKKDKNNNWNKVIEKSNLIVTSGKNYIADYMAGLTTNKMEYIAVGTDNTTPSLTDISLFSEIDRKIKTDSDGDGTIFRIETEFFEGEAVGNWKEVGIFDSATGGVMLNRVNVNFNKLTTDTVKVRFEITFN